MSTLSPPRAQVVPAGTVPTSALIRQETHRVLAEKLFVTGDKALLKRKRAGAVRIVNPREAWIILFSPLSAA